MVKAASSLEGISILVADQVVGNPLFIARNMLSACSLNRPTFNVCRLILKMEKDPQLKARV
jgi:hypothetical protein